LNKLLTADTILLKKVCSVFSEEQSLPQHTAAGAVNTWSTFLDADLLGVVAVFFGRPLPLLGAAFIVAFILYYLSRFGNFSFDLSTQKR
jgi:hypothetical protein